MNISQTIKDRMAELGYTRSDLATETGYSYPYIANLLRDSKRWNADSLQKVCEVLYLELTLKPDGDMEVQLCDQ